MYPNFVVCTICNYEYNSNSNPKGCPKCIKKTIPDMVNHPPHYTNHPSGIECIQITEHMNFNLGNAIKYIWRAGIKPHQSQIEDLQKATWYVQREIARLTRIN